VLARKPMNMWMIRKSSMAIRMMSMRLNTRRSTSLLESIMIRAAPAERPEARKSGPRMEVFHSGRALKAESRMPV
jgi:hypothetical protein